MLSLIYIGVSIPSLRSHPGGLPHICLWGEWMIRNPALPQIIDPSLWIIVYCLGYTIIIMVVHCCHLLFLCYHFTLYYLISHKAHISYIYRHQPFLTFSFPQNFYYFFRHNISFFWTCFSLYIPSYLYIILHIKNTIEDNQSSTVSFSH